MKIALYYPWIYLKSGVERSILETVKRSEHDYTIFTNHYDKKGTFNEFKKLKIIELKRIPIRNNILSAVYSALVIIFQKIQLNNFDVFSVHTEGFADLILFRNFKIYTIAVCYTPLRPVYDKDNQSRVLNKMNAFSRYVYRLLIHGFKIIDKFLWKRYKCVFFISRESLRRAKVGGLLKIPNSYKIFNPGIDWENIKPTKIFKKYFFLPGRITWSKNIELAIESFKIIQTHKIASDFKLIIAGHVDKKSNLYFERLKLLSNNNKNVVFIMNPNDKKLSKLYSESYAVLATAYNEDWGLTLIEANCHGKSVIAVNSGGYKETQKNNLTGFLVNNNPRLFSSKMLKLSEDKNLTKRLGNNARIYSKRFSWSNIIPDFDKKVNSLYTKSQKE